MKFQSLFALAVGVCSVFAADSQRYLLDRLQIEDTLSTMYWAFDTAEPNVLRDDVFASKITLDFRALFGGEVQTLSNAELVAYWTKLRNYATTAQHILTNVLPVPPGKKEDKSLGDRVDLFANVLVYLRRDVPGQESKEARADATLDLVVERIPGKAGSNPWRVAGLKANVVRLENYTAFWVDLK